MYVDFEDFDLKSNAISRKSSNSNYYMLMTIENYLLVIIANARLMKAKKLLVYF